MNRSSERQTQMAIAAGRPNTTNYVGARITKMILGIHLFTSHPTWKSRDVTTNRDTKFAEIHHRDRFYKNVDSTYLVSGMEEALKDFVAASHLSGIRRWRHFKSNFERNVPTAHVPPARVPDLILVEEILGYSFSERGLLREARNPQEPCPTYVRLEYLGDVVLDTVKVSRRPLAKIIKTFLAIDAFITLLGPGQALSQQSGHTSFGQYLQDYRSSLTAADIDVGPGTPDIQQVEAIIGYPFRNKRLIEEAFTLPDNGVRRNYERLEFLWDSVLDISHYGTPPNPQEAALPRRISGFQVSILQTVIRAGSRSQIRRRKKHRTRHHLAGQLEFNQTVVQRRLEKPFSVDEIGHIPAPPGFHHAAQQSKTEPNEHGCKRAETTKYVGSHLTKMGFIHVHVSGFNSVQDFSLVHNIDGISSLDEFVDGYMSSLQEADVDIEDGAPDNIKPNYERLEFLGDSILDVIAASSWIDRGEALGLVPQKATATVNNATLTVVGLEMGLDRYIRNCSAKARRDISQIKQSLSTRATNNTVYWTKGRGS
ncbi:MAG: hypothetical protein J3Q66DRAFT_393925 [Benniella sp.]|nr:MAG: hypothetical protein J3Q66DRAFT_393925 [Benniella sp.]